MKLSVGMEKNEVLLGAHTSTSGGLDHALREGHDIGATTIQLFTRNQRRWVNKPLEDGEVVVWKEVMAETGISHITSHSSYLINLASPDGELLLKSRKTFQDEVDRCERLGISYLTFHPGAAVGQPVEEALDRIVDSLREVRLSGTGNLLLLLETTAGQGTVLGATFDELRYIIDRVGTEVPLGVCMDTCHIFAAGYDLRDESAWNQTLQEFDTQVGISCLAAFHCNDSLYDLGSRLDRHANIGEGKIGTECFRFLMTDKRTANLPKYLETPGGALCWKKEIALLRKFL